MADTSQTHDADLQELLAALSRHQIDVPAERLDLILEEYRLLRGQMELISRQIDRSDRSHIMTPMRPVEKT